MQIPKLYFLIVSCYISNRIKGKVINKMLVKNHSLL